MKLFNRTRPVTPVDVLAPVAPSDTPIFARLAAESPLPTWDDAEAVAA
ncbi:hypothetical protein DEU38_13471 [Rhodococcus sp. AG1013]|nr:hypothetical protein [Rhodococcus sp. AG1013]RDI13496.1 hypothetical protein DEU38_13471 [Rhodococcus sp. AG1013]